MDFNIRKIKRMEVINSFFTNIKDKLTNPFFGTLIIILIVHHWQLWYAVFNFDPDCTLDDKLFFIRNYADKYLSFWPFMWIVVQSIFFMFLGYIIIVVTRSLVLWVEFWLMPWITRKVVNKNVVERKEYDEVVKEREEYFDQYEEQRKNVRIFSKTIDEQTEQIKRKDEDLLIQSETISKTIGELDSINKKLENSQSKNTEQADKIKKLDNQFEQLKIDDDLKWRQLEIFNSLFNEENKFYFDSYKKFPPQIVNKVNELKSENMWETFKDVGNFFENGGSIGGQALTEMREKEIAFERGSREQFTPLGRIIWRYQKVFENLDKNGAIL